MTLSNQEKFLLAFTLPLVVLLLHSFYYYPFFVDDAYISLRYADRFITGQGLTWNDGYYVEGYSNFLWVMLVSALGTIGFDLVAAGRAVCLLSSVATMAAFARYIQVHLGGRPIIIFLANMAFAFTAPVAVWSVGGLEATLSMALLTWAFVIGLPLLQAPSLKRAALCGLMLGLNCITRPEGVFFTAIFAACLFIFARTPRKGLILSLAMMCCVSAAFFAAHTGFRLWYYGQWVPNTYYAKVSGITYARLITGYLYTVKSTASFLPLVLLVCLQFDKIVRQKANGRERSVVATCMVILLAWLVSLTIAGGDLEPSYRHILPAVPLFILMAIEAMGMDKAIANDKKTAIFYAYILACFMWLQHSMEENDKNYYFPFEAQASELGKWLNTHYKDSQPLIAVTHAGAIPYYSKLPTIDTLGLNDLYLTHHRPDSFGTGLLGHELFNGDYVMSRRPDALIMYTGRSNWLYAHDMVESAEFQAEYKQVTVSLPSYTAILWVRRDSTKMPLPLPQ